MADYIGDETGNDFTGTADEDFMQGKEGDDFLRGKAGDDIIMGGKGNDILRGGGGDDTIRDGWGVDKLWGSTGADIFQFVGLEGIGGKETDIIRDFERGIDKIDLSAVTSDFGDITIRDTEAGHVRLKIGDRVILLRDKDDLLDAADLTVEDFILT